MQVFIKFKDPHMTEFLTTSATEWFISSDNLIVHVKTKNDHYVFPISGIHSIAVGR